MTDDNKMKKIILVIAIASTHICYSQSLPPKQPSPFNVKQIHSGHSLTDPLFHQYATLVGIKNSMSLGNVLYTMVGVSTIPGSPIRWRWYNPPGGLPITPGFVSCARLEIADYELLSITERVPLLYEVVDSLGIAQQKHYLSSFVNNAWNNGNNGNGAPTLLWTTWVRIDGSNGDFRQMLDIQGGEWERMQDYANLNRPAGAPPVYIIPGHKMMARLYDDIQLGIVPGIDSIHKFFDDNIHTNERGDYAVAMIHYACVFNANPYGITNDLTLYVPPHPNTPSLALASYLQTMIWDVVCNYPRAGINCSVTSISPTNTQKNNFNLYPNPVSSNNLMCEWNIDSETEVQVDICDVSGRIVKNICSKTMKVGNYQHTIDVSTILPGIYFIKIQFGTNVSMKKLVKN